MDTDLAILGIEIQAKGLDKALNGLGNLSTKSLEAEKNLGRVRQTFNTLGSTGGKVGSDLNQIFGKAFDSFFVSGREAESVLKSLEKDLLRLGSQQFGGGGGGKLLSSLSSSSSFTSVAGDLLSTLIPGFASGGQFTVGGAAGRDRNLVGMRLTRGERVTVENQAQQKNNAQAASSRNISLSFNITTPDASSFRQSQSQIQSEALRSAQRILKRNG